MEQYEKLKMEIITFEHEDVITSSPSETEGSIKTDIE